MPFLLLRKVFRPNALHHREREGEEGRKGRETERKGAGRREREGSGEEERQIRWGERDEGIRGEGGAGKVQGAVEWRGEGGQRRNEILRIWNYWRQREGKGLGRN